MKPIVTKNVDGLLERLEKKTDVRWDAGQRPTEFYLFDGYIFFHRVRRTGSWGKLTQGIFDRADGFELVTEDEFVEMIAGWLPKKKPTFEDVCRPVAEWIRDNAPGMAVSLDEEDAELYPKSIKRVEF